MNNLTVKNLLEDKRYALKLKLLAGKKGIGNKISSPKVQKTGLALAGFTDHFHKERIQILGNIEISYLKSLDNDERSSFLKKIFAFNIICFIVTFDLEISNDLLEAAEASNTPLLETTLPTDKFTTKIINMLEEHLTESTILHGVLVDVLGIGVLILGQSGIGKSECALDLVTKGHRLVADDVVIIRKRPPNIVIGSSPDLIRYHMEVRGLGIINIKDLFGITAIRVEKQVDLVVKLNEWNSDEEHDRLGFDKEFYQVLDIQLPIVNIPVTIGRNITTIIEVAARNHILTIMGHNPSIEFERNLNKEILANK